MQVKKRKSKIFLDQVHFLVLSAYYYNKLLFKKIGVLLLGN